MLSALDTIGIIQSVAAALLLAGSVLVAQLIRMSEAEEAERRRPRRRARLVRRDEPRSAPRTKAA